MDTSNTPSRKRKNGKYGKTKVSANKEIFSQAYHTAKRQAEEHLCLDAGRTGSQARRLSSGVDRKSPPRSQRCYCPGIR